MCRQIADRRSKPAGPSLACATWFLALAVVAVSLEVTAVHGFGLDDQGRRVALVASSTVVVLLSGLAAYWFRSAVIVCLGALTNLSVILANGGAMPIEITTAADVRGQRVVEIRQVDGLLDRSKDVALDREDINLYLLADRIQLSIPPIGRNVYSVGDVCLAVGLLVVSAEVAFRLSLGRGSTEGTSPKPT